MPALYLATGRTAGEECSSTYEGRHITLEESYLTHPYHADGFVDKGDPVNCGDIVGVAFNSAAAATDYIAIDTEGIWFLNVVASDDVGTSAVAPGDELYINTGVVSKRASGIPFGKSLGVLTGSAVAAVCAVKVHCELRDVDPSMIVVSTEGDDTTGKGCWDSPYATVTKAFTMVTATRKTVYILPGDYAETTGLTWPSINGLRVIGMDGQGNVSISALDGTAVLTINPTVQTASFEAFLENVNIDHGDIIGIELNNTATAKKVIVQLKSVSAEAGSGASLHCTHTDAGNAIRLYAKNCQEIEGLVDWHLLNASDRIRFYDSVLAGGLTTSANAVAGELTLSNTVILTGGLTIGDAAHILTYRACLYRTDADPSIYTELADAYSA